MKKLFKASAAAAMIGLLAFAAAGCGGGDKKAAEKKEVVKMGVTNFADSLETTDNYFGWVVMRYGLGECLVKFDKKMNSTPWLADKWTISDDKLTWTFHINDKACFSNGNKLTGEIAAASILRTFEKAPRAQSMFEYESIKGEGQNVIIKTKKPVPTLPGMLGDPLFIIVDTSTIKDRDTAKQGAICTGPYAVKTYSKAKAEMVRNEHYWDGPVPFKAVDILTIDDPNTRAMALQKGEIDFAINIAAGDLQLFKDKNKFNISEISSLRDVLARLNVRPERPLGDLKVRQALLRSLDRVTYNKVLLKDTFVPGGPYLPPSVDYGYDELYKQDPNQYNPESAKKLLEEAGWKDTNGDGYVDKDGKNLEMDFIFYSGRAELPLYAEATQADAKKVGIKVNLKNVDYNVLDGIGRRGEYDLCISNILCLQAGDPEVFMKQYLTTGQEQNGSGYSNPEYDALSDKLSVEFDPAKRREIIIAMQKVILNDAASLVFGHPQTNMVSSKVVADAEILPCDYYWLTKDIKPAQ
ncbi:MAG: ABC transporter substrate-binding protein [Phascolarctobacterium sp.]|uniref:ABC transporter substrate-binding protein n=1 Tax=Phascolarctobacterium sp. TaxID=2049039 RepID=UPI0026DB7099|nr:ABC transporter substrate-binding protein [Phascolarctobacterium sp.]MDO4920527.1 ABC transporter substrate-binding protein [Phascolarctobacterium sp.]